jgi:hypothetical protein
MSERDARGTVRLECFGVTDDEMSALAEELKRHFRRVEIAAVPTPPAASPPFAEYSAVLIVAGTLVVNGFFSEMGKDAYKLLRARIIELCQRAYPTKQNRGGYTFGIRCDRRASYVLFNWYEPPIPHQFDTALEAIPSLVATIPDDQWAQFWWETESEQWSGPSFPPEDYKGFLRRGQHALPLDSFQKGEPDE